MTAVAPEDMVGKENEALALNKVVEQVILNLSRAIYVFLRVLKTRPEGEVSITVNDGPVNLVWLKMALSAQCSKPFLF